MRLLLMLLVLGLLVAIALAWFYAVTPSGLRREDDLDRSETGAPDADRRINWLIAVLLSAPTARRSGRRVSTAPSRTAS